MNIQTRKDALTITLAEECTIADVEADADQLRHLPDQIKQIHVLAEGVQECDTAYLQLLLALRVTAEQQGAAFTLHPSASLKELWELYLHDI